ncbi:hypothetical protein BKG76_06275 [Mycobacteroides franklinii]|uniref:Type I restriction modification DNA specificity domain-containing protein n=2 Tax=Mycobacteroides franklinii TaxID=948102 RepID=A0A1S1LJ13_9MYCO|nr:hypothetical protein BKG76_06275 [Mycobacteroides franklinii]
MLRGSNLSDDVGVRLDESEIVFVPEELARTYSRSIVEPGDLVFTCWGTVGQLGLIQKSSRFDSYLVSNKQMKMTADPLQVVPLFLYYYLSQRRMIDLVRSQAIGSSVPGFNLGQLKALPISLPEMSQQRAIADVLGALDDKIAANERICELTDQLVSATFASLVNGCSWGELRAIADVNLRTLKPHESGSLRYMDIATVGCGRYEMPDLSNWATAPGRARRGVSRGDTVWSTVRPNRRSHALVLDDCNELVASTGLAVLTPHSRRVAGLYEATRTEEFVRYLESVAEGSAYPAVRGDRFGAAPIPDLSPAQWDRFEDIAFSVRERAHSARVEARKLAQTRDELLPLLMSGKLRVKDAETIVAEVL